AEVVEASHEALDLLQVIAAREVIGAEVAILDAVLEHVPDGGEHRGGDGEDRFLGSPTCAQAQELGVQVAALDAHRAPGGGYQGGLQPGRAFTSASGATFAGAFVVSGT